MSSEDIPLTPSSKKTAVQSNCFVLLAMHFSSIDSASVPVPKDFFLRDQSYISKSNGTPQSIKLGKIRDALA